MALAKAVGDDDVERLSELLACREAEDPFGSLVAEADDALRISIDDGVRGVVHQRPVEPVDLARISQRCWVHRRSDSAKSVVQQHFFEARGRTPMLTECIPDLFGFARVEGHKVVGAFDGGRRRAACSAG